MRIASLLPSATEIVCALGLEDALVGVSHSCDFPAGLDRLPVLTRTAVPVEATSGEIDAFVRRYLGGHRALYELDLEALDTVNADLVVSQRLCDVCAVSADEVDEALCGLASGPTLVDLEPSCVEDIFGDLQRVAIAAGAPERAGPVIDGLRARIDEVRARSATLAPEARPRVAVVEWLEPPFNSGHWVPELVHAAGAVDILGPERERSYTIRWDDVLAAQPEVLLISVCGFSIARTRQELARLSDDPVLSKVLEMLAGRVLLLDGNAYLARPGPRVVDALEGLAHALHPDLHPAAERAAPVEPL